MKANRSYLCLQANDFLLVNVPSPYIRCHTYMSVLFPISVTSQCDARPSTASISEKEVCDGGNV